MKSKENIKWIDELKNRIIEEDDKILFGEAAGCFLSNHYRAAYILTWISIVESLKRKIQLFSNLGDSRAQESIKEIENAEKQKISTDKLIFEEAKKCAILDSSDISTINFLWEQRCLFAHPYNKEPEEDEVKYILGQSVKLVLAKELFYNKRFLTELAENISNKPFFLPIENDIIREFARRTIARIHENLHPFFFKTLLFKVGEIILNQEKHNELRKLRLFIIELFVNTPLPLDSIKWSLEDRVTRFPYECFIGFVEKKTWNLFPIRIKDMLIGYVISETDENKLIYLKTVTSRLIEHDVLELHYKAKYFDRLNVLDFNSVINFYGEKNAKYNRIIRELESGQYEQQNPVIDYFRSETILSFINSLEKEDLFYLGRLLKYVASHGHWKTQNFIQEIVSGSKEMPDYLKAGLAYSAFISKQNEYSLSSDFVLIAIKLLNQIDVSIQNEVYDKIIDVLQNEKPDSLDKEYFNEASLIKLSKYVLENIENLNDINKKRFENLIEEIKKYFA